MSKPLTIRATKIQRPDGTVKKIVRLVGTTTMWDPESETNKIVKTRIDIDDEQALALLSGKGVAELASAHETSAEAEAKIYSKVEVFVPGGATDAPTASASSAG